MKKFVGTVNGKSFDNEEDFRNAANEAVKSSDGNLAISSYYSYTTDDDTKVDVKDDNFVSASEYFIGDRTPDKISKDSVEYSVSETLAGNIRKASNKDHIKQSIVFHLSDLNKCIDSQEKRASKLEEDIEDLQNTLYKVEGEVMDMKGRQKYYNTLLDILNEKEPKKEPEKETQKKAKEILRVDDNTSLFDILKQLGILK